jgi:hypothetical protein
MEKKGGGISERLLVKWNSGLVSHGIEDGDSQLCITVYCPLLIFPQCLLILL